MPDLSLLQRVVESSPLIVLLLLGMLWLLWTRLNDREVVHSALMTEQAIRYDGRLSLLEARLDAKDKQLSTERNATLEALSVVNAALRDLTHALKSKA